ncbi:hypothetical protein [Burkholderia sp. PU8-34]
MAEESRDKAHELLLQLVASKSVSVPSGYSAETEAEQAKHAIDYLSVLYAGLKSMYEGGEK